MHRDRHDRVLITQPPLLICADMPVASSSRYGGRRSRRAPTSDIEDDNTTVAAMQVDAVEDDEQPAIELARALNKAALPGRPDKPTKTAKGKKRRQAAEESDDQDEDEEDEPLPELGNNPLDKTHAAKIRGIASDWGSMREKIHIPSYTMMREVAAAVAEYTEGEKGERVCNNGFALLAFRVLTPGTVAIGAFNR